MAQQIITELIIDAKGALAGAQVYTQAMNAAAAARDRVLGADERAAELAAKQAGSMVTVAQSLSRVQQQWDKLRASIDPTTDALLKYERAVKAAGASAEQAVLKQISSEKAALAVLNERVRLAQQEFQRAGTPTGSANSPHTILGTQPAGAARESAAVFEAEFVRIEELARMHAEQVGQNFQAGLNASFGIGGGVGKAARESAAVFDLELSKMEEIAELRAQQIGQSFQSSLNQYFGVGAQGKSARDSAAVFSAQLDHMEEIARLKAQQIGQSFQTSLNQAFGIGTPVKSAQASAGVFQEAFDQSKALDDLRAKYIPVHAAEKQRIQALADIRTLVREGSISERERVDAVNRVNVAYGNAMATIRRQSEDAAKGGRLVSGEVANLSFQLNDVLTGIALGQSPFMILAQQGGQVYQILANSKEGIANGLGSAVRSLGTTVKEAAFGMVNWFTPVRLVWTSITTAIVGATIALGQYESSQRNVALSLTGMGRASGATQGGINSIAAGSASTFGLSVSEAREFAAELAVVGRIGQQEIEPLVKLGHDFAVTFGVEGKEAAQLLGKALSDPAKGAEELNRRLGFLDAAMERQIINLAEQNKLAEAQRIIIEGIQSSIASAADVTGFWSKVWTGLGNLISNAMDKIGQATSPSFMIGGLEDQIRTIKEELSTDTWSGWLNSLQRGAFGSELLRGRLEFLEAQLIKTRNASEKARQADESRRVLPQFNSLLPERDQLQKLINQQMVVGAATEDPIMLRRLGITQEQADRARAIINDVVANFKTAFQAMETTAQIAFDAIEAFSPLDKASIAFRQQAEQLRARTDLTPEEKRLSAQRAYNNSLQQSYTAIKEQTRAEVLNAEQSVQSVQQNIRLIGASIEERERLRGELQITQAVEQRISAERLQNDPVALELLRQRTEALKAENAEKAKSLATEQRLAAIEKLRVEADQLRRPTATRGAAEAVYSAFGNRSGDDMAKQAISDQVLLVEALRQTVNQEDLVRAGLTEMFKAIQRAAQTAPDLLKALGLSPAEVDKIKAALTEIEGAFMTTVERTQRANAIANQAITAYSPTQKGKVAEQQTQLQLADQVVRRTMDQAQADKFAKDAGQLATRQALEGLREAARERELSAAQVVAQSHADVAAIGQTVGAQYQLRAELQAKQQLETEAAKNRTQVDLDHLERLKVIIGQTAALKQLEAERGLASKIGFDRQLIGLDANDQAVANQLRPIYGDQWESQMGSGLAQGIRFNQMLSTTKDIAGEALKGFVADLRAGKTMAEALQNVLGRIADRLIQMAIDKVVANAFGGLISMFPGAPTGAALQPIAAQAGGFGAGFVGPIPTPTGHSGALIGSWASGSRMVDPALFSIAPRMHAGTGPGGINWAAGERPFVGLTGERVLNRRETAEYNKPTVVKPQVVIHNHGADVKERVNEDGDLEFTVRNVVRHELGEGSTNAVMRGKNGISPRVINRG